VTQHVIPCGVFPSQYHRADRVARERAYPAARVSRSRAGWQKCSRSSWQVGGERPISHFSQKRREMGHPATPRRDVFRAERKAQEVIVSSRQDRERWSCLIRTESSSAPPSGSWVSKTCRALLGLDGSETRPHTTIRGPSPHGPDRGRGRPFPRGMTAVNSSRARRSLGE
jgi:hypothetical protein